MPTCKKCGVTMATAEMRRSPTTGYLYKNKITCSRRRKEAKKK